jgi:hypothetical protein
MLFLFWRHLSEKLNPKQQYHNKKEEGDQDNDFKREFLITAIEDNALLGGGNVDKAIENVHKVESSEDKPPQQAVWLSIAVIDQMEEVDDLI